MLMQYIIEDFVPMGGGEFLWWQMIVFIELFWDIALHGDV